jgi:hypothetical protein
MLQSEFMRSIETQIRSWMDNKNPRVWYPVSDVAKFMRLSDDRGERSVMEKAHPKGLMKLPEILFSSSFDHSSALDASIFSGKLIWCISSEELLSVFLGSRTSFTEDEKQEFRQAISEAPIRLMSELAFLRIEIAEAQTAKVTQIVQSKGINLASEELSLRLEQERKEKRRRQEEERRERERD